MKISNVNLNLRSFVIQSYMFFIFIGPYIGIGNINLGNIYSLILMGYFFYDFINKKYTFNKNYIIIIYVVLLYAFSSIIWGKYSYIGIKIAIPLITCFFSMTFLAGLNKYEFDLFMKNFNIFTKLVIILALIEVLTGKYIIFNNINFINTLNVYGYYYPGVFFVNPNDLGQFIVISVPICFYKEETNFKRILLLISSIFILTNTSSRMAMISFFIFILFFSVKTFNIKRRLNVKYILAFIILISIIAIIFNQFSIFEDFLNISTKESYFTIRENIYSDVYDLWKNNFLFGSGLGGSYYISGIGTHNLFLFILADLGMISAFILILAFIILIFNIIKKVRKKSLVKLKVGIISIWMSFPLVSSISSANEQRKIIWILIGITLAMLNISSEAKRIEVR